MNVTFHTLASLATATALCSRQRITDSSRLFIPADVPVLAIGFAAGVLMHGLLDFAPHAYPIKSAVDVLLGLALFLAALQFALKRHWHLLSVCFLGAIFPDLVDLGPRILNKHLGWSLPTVRIFPWHYPQYSGSIYDGSRSAESLLYHLLVVGVSLGLLYANRSRVFSWRGRVQRGEGSSEEYKKGP